MAILYKVFSRQKNYEKKGGNIEKFYEELPE